MRVETLYVEPRSHDAKLKSRFVKNENRGSTLYSKCYTIRNENMKGCERQANDKSGGNVPRRTAKTSATSIVCSCCPAARIGPPVPVIGRASVAHVPWPW